MISAAGALTRSQIMLIKPLMKKLDIPSARLAQDALGKLGTKALGRNITFEAEPFERFEAEWAVPRRAKESGAILYLHGGSYTAGTLDYAKGFGALLAQNTGLRTLCVGYRLAPEHPYPAALDDALAAYMRVLENTPSSKIVLAGESAGGGLTFALALKIRDMGMPAAAGIVAMSPWTDLTCSATSYIANADLDPTLSQESLRYSAGLYAGDTPLRDPYVSPAFSAPLGLPPTLIYTGTHELLMDDTVLMSAHLRAAGVECETHLVDGMWHVFVLFSIPEAKEALSDIVSFVNGKTGK